MARQAERDADARAAAAEQAQEAARREAAEAASMLESAGRELGERQREIEERAAQVRYPLCLCLRALDSLIIGLCRVVWRAA